MNYLTPLIGPQWSELSQQYELNANERNTRFDKAQGRKLFEWVECLDCKQKYREVVGHDCPASTEQIHQAS